MAEVSEMDDEKIYSLEKATGMLGLADDTILKIAGKGGVDLLLKAPNTLQINAYSCLAMGLPEYFGFSDGASREEQLNAAVEIARHEDRLYTYPLYMDVDFLVLTSSDVSKFLAFSQHEVKYFLEARRWSQDNEIESVIPGDSIPNMPRVRILDLYKRYPMVLLASKPSDNTEGVNDIRNCRLNVPINRSDIYVSNVELNKIDWRSDQLLNMPPNASFEKNKSMSLIYMFNTWCECHREATSKNKQAYVSRVLEKKFGLSGYLAEAAASIIKPDSGSARIDFLVSKKYSVLVDIWNKHWASVDLKKPESYPDVYKLAEYLMDKHGFSKNLAVRSMVLMTPEGASKKANISIEAFDKHLDELGGMSIK